MIIDTHAHIDVEQFDEDREEVIARAREAGVQYLVNVGCDVESSRRSLDLAEQYDFIYSTAGVHPHDVKSIDEHTYARLRELLAHPRVIAVGETGLDYFKNYSPQEDQRIHFRKQVELARELNKPLIIHTRDAGKTPFKFCPIILRKIRTRIQASSIVFQAISVWRIRLWNWDSISPFPAQ